GKRSPCRTCRRRPGLLRILPSRPAGSRRREEAEARVSPSLPRGLLKILASPSGNRAFRQPTVFRRRPSQSPRDQPPAVLRRPVRRTTPLLCETLPMLRPEISAAEIQLSSVPPKTPWASAHAPRPQPCLRPPEPGAPGG